MKYLLLAIMALTTFNTFGQKTYKKGDPFMSIIPDHTETIYEVRGWVKYQQLQGNHYTVMEVNPDYVQTMYVDDAMGMIIFEDALGNQEPMLMTKVVQHNGYKTYYVSNENFEEYETSVYTYTIDVNRAGYMVYWEDGNTKKVEYKITKKTFTHILRTDLTADEPKVPKETHKEAPIADTMPKPLRVYVPD